jgi:hypothetical protein
MDVENSMQVRLTYAVEELVQVLGIRRAAAYAALRTGAIPAIRLNRRFVISKAAIELWLRESPGTTCCPFPRSDPNRYIVDHLRPRK